MTEQLTEIETLRRNVVLDPFNVFARRLYAERLEELGYEWAASSALLVW